MAIIGFIGMVALGVYMAFAGTYAALFYTAIGATKKYRTERWIFIAIAVIGLLLLLAAFLNAPFTVNMTLEH